MDKVHAYMALKVFTPFCLLLAVRRPVDYKPELVPVTGAIPKLDIQYLESLGCTLGAEGSGRVFIGGLPYHLTDEQVLYVSMRIIYLARC